MSFKTTYLNFLMMVVVSLATGSLLYQFDVLSMNMSFMVSAIMSLFLCTSVFYTRTSMNSDVEGFVGGWGMNMMFIFTLYSILVGFTSVAVSLSSPAEYQITYLPYYFLGGVFVLYVCLYDVVHLVRGFKHSPN